MAYSHIDRIDRQLFSDIKRRKVPLAWGARIAEVHRSSIHRELKRNTDDDGHYNSHHAHARARARRTQARGTKLANNPRLRQWVLEKLALRWSPQQISQQLNLELPDDSTMRISHKAIYDFIAADRKQGVDSPCGGKLYQLRRRRRPYRRNRTQSGRTCIPDRVGIEHRPAHVQLRQEPGHLEGDTIYGQATNACLLTIVDRKTRLVRIRRCPNRRAKTIAAATLGAMTTLNPLHSITFDNGKEFSHHRQLTQQTRIAAFFANPYHSWERGSNENTNGLIRDFFPRGTHFSRVSDHDVAQVEAMLNNRPRKCLGWRTPNQAHDAEPTCRT